MHVPRSPLLRCCVGGAANAGPRLKPANTASMSEGLLPEVLAQLHPDCDDQHSHAVLVTKLTSWRTHAQDMLNYRADLNVVPGPFIPECGDKTILKF